MPISQSALVELKAGGNRRPLICVHPVDGTLNIYRRLLGQFPDELPVYGLKADDEINPDESLSKLAARYCDELMASHLDQPFRLIGFSFGALVAMHVAAEIEARGGNVEFVGVVDYRPFAVGDLQAMRECLAKYLSAVHEQYGRRSSVLRSLPGHELAKATAELAAYLLNGDKLPTTEDGVVAFQKLGLLDPTVRVEQVAAFFRPMFGRLGWLESSNLRSITAPLLVWRAAEGFGAGHGEWSMWTTDAREEAPLPGNHLTAMQAQSARRLAGEIFGWVEIMDATAHL
jgi:thioesterase domain-containing protein